MTDEVIRELYRSRWRRAREALNVVEAGRNGFGTGGLGGFVRQLSVRLLVLPGDPEGKSIEFDQSLWEWWKALRTSPFGSPVDWGSDLLPTSGAAVRCVSLHEEKCDSYLALSRHAGLDVGLGPEGAAEHNGKRIFWLVRIVGRLWAALDLYREVAERFGVVGPWECAVALINTRDGSLGNFGSGWVEYPDPGANPRRCPEPNLLWRCELDKWPGADKTRQLVFSIGGWIEDSWGMQCRRFLAHSGPLAGQFDSARHR